MNLRIMIIVVVNKRLEVANLDLLLAAFALNQRVQLEEHPVALGTSTWEGAPTDRIAL